MSGNWPITEEESAPSTTERLKTGGKGPDERDTTRVRKAASWPEFTPTNMKNEFIVFLTFIPFFVGMFLIQAPVIALRNGVIPVWENGLLTYPVMYILGVMGPCCAVTIIFSYLWDKSNSNYVNDCYGILFPYEVYGPSGEYTLTDARIERPRQIWPQSEEMVHT